MADSKVRTHQFDKKKEKRKQTDREEEEKAQKTPERRSIEFQAPDAEMTEKTEDHTHRQISTKRIWSKRGHATSAALYQIAATPQMEATDSKAERISKRDVDKETQELLKQTQELSLQMKQQLEQLQSAGASSADQMSSKQEALLQQVESLLDIAQKHDD